MSIDSMICWKGGNRDFSEKSMVVGLSFNYILSYYTAAGRWDMSAGKRHCILDKFLLFCPIPIVLSYHFHVYESRMSSTACQVPNKFKNSFNF